MQATANFSTYAGTLGRRSTGAAWTVVLTGELTTTSIIECSDGKVEYAVANTAPATTALRGHILNEGESQTVLVVAASQEVYARAVTQDATLVVTPGDAAA